jgi:hypothetical protein
MLSGRHTSAASCEMTQPAPTPTAPRMAGTAKQRWLRPGPPHGCIIARAVGCTHSAAAGSKHSTSHVNGSAPCGAPPPWAPQLPASRWQTPPCGHGDGSQPASQPATRTPHAAPAAAAPSTATSLPICGTPNALASLSSAFYSPMWPRAPSPSALLMLLLWQPVTVTLVPPASNNQPGWKCRCANQSLCTPLSSIPARREIFAYYEDHWSEGSYNQSWHDLFSGGTVTTIAVCEGHAVQEPGLATARMSDEHLCFAHAHNVRVVPGCVGCDVWSGAPDALSRCPVRRALPLLCCGVGRRLLS